ncbi:MAG: hypothetical protein WBL20_08115 [Sphingobium sp.]|uniref:hypothetical protein n=1 Tax=Sphingobium sp. TaxID=1912891 RepID=UPI003BB0FA14
MSDIIEQGRKLAEEYNRDGSGFSNDGRKNAYECEACGSYIITVDRAPGVTPFLVKCGSCGAMAQSKFYRVRAWLSPTHEWYRPETLDGIDPAYHEHLSKGGLILRPIPGRSDVWSPNDFKKAPDAAEERRALEAAFQKARLDEAAGEMSRQQRRWKDRKSGREAPEEIAMYGRRYRRID